MSEIHRPEPVEIVAGDSERLCRLAFEGAAAGMALVAFTGDMMAATTARFVKVNQALCDFFGRSAAEFLDAADGLAFLTSLTHPDDVRGNLEGFQRLIAGEVHVYRGQKRFLRRSGEIRWGDLTLAAVHDAGGRLAFAVTQVFDITEPKQLPAQMLHAQKLESLGVLAGGIAHNFNNLLTTMLGYACLVQTALPADAPALPMIREIENAVRRAAELAGHMLVYCGKGKFVLRLIDLSSLVQESATLLQNMVSPKAHLQFGLASDLPAIEADAAQIGQVVVNLVTNASEALGEQSGVIALRTGVLQLDQPQLYSPYAAPDTRPGTFVYVEVSDSGRGMEAATLARIFDPFFTTKFMGRGLGLAVVHGIVRGHHGLIKVTSQPGQGSSFQVLFPVSTQRLAPNTDPAAAAGQRTLLVIDDELAVRTLIQCVLEQAGYRVLLAEGGQEGIDVFRRQHDHIDGVLLDLTMPHLNGLETLAMLRGIQPNVRVLLMSGYGEHDVKSHLSGQQLAGFVPKPFGIDELVSLVGSGLELAKPPAS